MTQMTFLAPHAFTTAPEHPLANKPNREFPLTQWAQQVCEVRETLAPLDRRCASAESALHGAVSHGQVIDAIRSVIGPLREQLETRLTALENDISDTNDSLGQGSTNTRELSAVSIRTLCQHTKLQLLLYKGQSTYPPGRFA